MKTCVVDASVIAAAFFQEEHAAKARDLLLSGCELHAPDLLYAETANVICKRHARREITPDEAAALANDLLHLPIRIAPCAELVRPALALAFRIGRNAYDCIYVALAVESKSILVSGDQRLLSSLKNTPFARHILWIGEYS
jgi:predicted nucleic acid-binding protein